MKIRHAALSAGVCLALALACSPFLWGGGEARGIERNFAGSAQLAYLYVPTDRLARDQTFDGFTTELSLKLAVDFNENVSVDVKTCYGCHGFEMGMAVANLRVSDALSFRVGRFTPAFGDFPARHDPANHRTSDKPLPYDMGRMLRLREYNMSVLPAPYVDNGLEVRGTLNFGARDRVALDYHAYVVGGLRGGRDAQDVDWIQMRSGAFYYVDNNSTPTAGGRLALTIFLTETASLKVGGSFMYGTYDPDNEQAVMLGGADLVLRIDKWTLRSEYLFRRTEMALDPSAFLYGPGKGGVYDPWALQDGWYVSTDYPLGEHWELVGRFDGLRRIGNTTDASSLRSRSMMLRYTAGVNYRFAGALRIKLNAELYDFSDFSDEVAINLAFVGAF